MDGNPQGQGEQQCTESAQDQSKFQPTNKEKQSINTQVPKPTPKIILSSLKYQHYDQHENAVVSLS